MYAPMEKLSAFDIRKAIHNRMDGLEDNKTPVPYVYSAEFIKESNMIFLYNCYCFNYENEENEYIFFIVWKENGAIFAEVL